MTVPPRPRTRRPGISLLEVLLALAVFLLAIVAIGQLIDIGTDAALDANSQSAATRLAQSKLAEAEAGAIQLTGPSSGTFDAEPEWSWSVEPTATDVKNVFTVTVTTSRKLRNKTFSVTLTQMVLDPQAMGQADEAQKPTTTTGTTTATTGTTP